MSSPSEFGLAIEVTDGPKTLLSTAEADRSAGTETYIFVSFICMLYECSMSGKYVFNICFYSC